MSGSSIRMGSAFIELTTKDSNLQKGLRRAGAQLAAFGKSAEAAGRAMLATFAVVAAPVALAVKRFADFDDQMRLTKAVTNSTGKEFAALTEQAKKLGRETSFTAAQVAGGMAALGRMGFNQSEISSSIGSVMDLARATGTDLGEAAGIASNALRAFGLNASQTGAVADILTATANGSAQTLSDLGEALTYAAPAAKSAGETITDVNAALGVLANVGIRGSMAGNALKRAYSQLAKTSTQDYLRQLGIEAVDADGNLRKMSDVLRDCAAAMATMGSAEKIAFATEVFGERAAGSALAFTGDIKAIDEFLARLQNAQGIASRTAKEMDAGLGGAMRITASAIEGAGLALGEALVPTLQAAAQYLISFMGKLTTFIQNNQGLITSLAKVAIQVALVGGGLLVLGRTVSIVAGSIRVMSGVLTVMGTAYSVMRTGVLLALGSLQNFLAGLALVREAMAASNGALTVRAFTEIAAAMGIATTAVNKYVVTMLAASNVEVGQKVIVWIKSLPALFSSAVAAISAYIARLAAGTTANVAFAASAQGLKATLSGIWTAIAGTVVSIAKYITTCGIATAATAALGITVKALAAAVGVLTAALTFLAAHPLIAAITAALALLVGIAALFAKKSHDAAEQAKRDADTAREAYDKAKQNRAEGQAKRVQAHSNFEALKKLAEASEQSQLTAEEMETAVSLINSLDPFGSANWAHLDETTGRLVLAKDAMDQFNAAARKQAMGEVQEERKALDQQEEALGRQEMSPESAKELAKVRENKQAAEKELVQAYNGTDEGIYGQKINPTDSDKAEDAARKRQASLEKYLEALKEVEKYEKDNARSNMTELEQEIEKIDEANKKYKEMLQTLIKFEEAKPKDKQNQKKLAEWRTKLSGADADAEKKKQAARDKESKSAVTDLARQQRTFEKDRQDAERDQKRSDEQRQIDDLKRTDPGKALQFLQNASTKFAAATEEAAKEYQAAIDAAKAPDADGVVRVTEEEQQRIDAAKEKYSDTQSRADNYRNQMIDLAQKLQGSNQTRTVSGFDASVIASQFAKTSTNSPEERSAKSAENIERLVKQILSKFSGSNLALAE